MSNYQNTNVGGRLQTHIKQPKHLEHSSSHNTHTPLSESAQEASSETQKKVHKLNLSSAHDLSEKIQDVRSIIISLQDRNSALAMRDRITILQQAMHKLENMLNAFLEKDSFTLGEATIILKDLGNCISSSKTLLQNNEDVKMHNNRNISFGDIESLRLKILNKIKKG